MIDRSGDLTLRSLLKVINRLHIAVLSDVTSCSLVGIYPEDRDSRFVRNIGTCILNACKKTVMPQSVHVYCS
jgi:hypothetical protein